MKYIKLNDVERETLSEGYKKHKKHHMRVRFHALLLSGAGRQVKDIALISATHTRTIYTWMDNWEAYGIAGLMIKKGHGVRSWMWGIGNWWIS